MEDCIFCKIVSKEIPSHKIFEDERVYAFLDIHPINPGHILVMPKKHVEDFYNLETADYQAMMTVSKKLAADLHEKLHPKRVGLAIVGWDMPHTHAHVVPMNDYYDITSKSVIDDTRGNPTQEELEAVATVLTAR